VDANPASDTDCPDPTPPRQVRPAGDANPFEAYLLAVCALQGWSVLAGTATPTSLSHALTPTLRLVWATLLLIGGILSVVGLYWPRNPITGVEIKRVGLVAAGTASLTYGLALVFIGPAGYVAASLSLSFALACVTRVVQVTRRIRGTRRRIVAARDPEG
jgi:hypothetical protein